MKHLNNKGYSLIELSVALFVSLILGLGAFQVLTKSNKISQIFNKKVEDRIEAMLGEKVLMKDLKLTSPSLNNLIFKDDNDLNFFDYDHDKSSPFYRAQTKKFRVLTLSKGGNSKIFLLTADEARGKALFVDAVNFFEVGASPISISNAASLTYKGLNYNNYLTTNAPLMLNASKLLIADSSSLQYPIDATTDISRPAVFIGKVTAGEFSDLAKINLPNNMFSYTIKNPAGVSVEPTNFESFLLNLPPAGANGASIRIKGVKLIMYELDCSKRNCELFRSDYSSLDPTSVNRYSVVRDINKVVFSRDDIATSVFKFQLFK